MTNEIIEGNKLIAEFMGHQGYSCKDAYDENWNALMPVVDKIESIDGCSYKIHLSYSIGFVNDNSQHGNPNIIRGIGKSRIETAYDLVIKFIQWYNLNPPSGNEK